ncbi:MAG: hypothetical protein ACKOUD_04320 [Rhodoluna sp.]
MTASVGQAVVGQQVNFAETAVLHYRTSVLLAKTTEVRFTPESVTWTFSDGFIGTSQLLVRSTDREGYLVASARVVYSVDYRIAGSATWVASGQIAVSASTQIRVVGVDSPVVDPPDGVRAVLVANNCLQNPAAYGCQP